jgi:hypothetical protein
VITTEPTYASTAQHIRLIAERRRRLERAQIDAEERFVHAVARDFRAGLLSLAELESVYVSVQSAALSGFATKRWQAELPGLHSIRSLITQAAKAESAALDSWVGAFPVEDHTKLPPAGIAVVYVLYDEAASPCYVGSTGALGTRLAEHVRTGKRCSAWQAHRCRDREHAYEVETQFLQQYKPYLNKRASR